MSYIQETRHSGSDEDEKFDAEKAPYSNLQLLRIAGQRLTVSLEVDEDAVPLPEFDDPNLDRDDAIVGVLGA
jgi:hypothetical protein